MKKKRIRFHRVQRLYLELIKITGFNSFDGKKAYKLLIENRHLWKSVIMERDVASDDTPSFLKLRDMPDAFHNVGTILMMVDKKIPKKELVAIAKQLGADDYGFKDRMKTGTILGCFPPRDNLFYMWFD